MKICKKCNNTYFEKYLYCPKCGAPYNIRTKYAKVPGELSHEFKDFVSNFCSIILYIIGFVLIFVNLLYFKEHILLSVVAILLAFSLFRIFYIILRDLLNVNNIIIILLRIVIPFLFFLNWVIIALIQL